MKSTGRKQLHEAGAQGMWFPPCVTWGQIASDPSAPRDGKRYASDKLKSAARELQELVKGDYQLYKIDETSGKMPIYGNWLTLTDIELRMWLGCGGAMSADTRKAIVQRIPADVSIK